MVWKPLGQMLVWFVQVLEKNEKISVKMMEYDYNSFRRESDFHNKCCGGMFWCIRDICGIICAILTWLLISYAEFVVMSVILYPSPNTIYSVINTIIFQTCAFLAFASHLKTMFTDPVSKVWSINSATIITQLKFINSNLKCIYFRVQYQKAMPPRKWWNKWVLGKVR